MSARLTRTGLRGTPSARELERLRTRFAREDHVRICRFLDDDLLLAVDEALARSRFVERVHPGIGDNKELAVENASTLGGLLHLLTNTDELFDLVEQITECGRIGSFSGRVYRVVPGRGHRDAWHSDVGDHRLVALTINLGRRPYRGGVLQMRNSESRRVLRDIPNPGYGDAVLFRISPTLQHRITEIDGTIPKTAFAGWFKSEPSFRALLAAAATRA